MSIRINFNPLSDWSYYPWSHKAASTYIFCDWMISELVTTNNFLNYIFHDWLILELVTSTLQPDPLYFSKTTSNNNWPSKIYLQLSGIASIALCSSRCSLDPGICQLFVYISKSGICYLGQLAASTTLVTGIASGNEVMYTRMCK